MSNASYYNPVAPQSYAHPHYSQQLSSEEYLSQLFPNIDRTTIRSVLSSTRGEVDPAYKALQAISGSNTLSSNSSWPSSHFTSTNQMPLSGQSTPPFVPQHVTNFGQTSSSWPQPSHYNAPVSSIPVHTQPSHLTPIASAPACYSPLASPNILPHSGSVAPNNPSLYHNLHHAHSGPSQISLIPPTPVSLPDLGKLNLGDSIAKVSAHWARCDGCNADPIKGQRWRCLPCADYDLCGDCKNAGVHNHHRLEEMRIGIENHPNIYCDGCGSEGRSLLGVRFACLKHEDEDWCENCIKSHKACEGPFKQIKQTDVGRQLEVEGCVPMPQGWVSHLRPAVAIYNIEESITGLNNWLDWPEEIRWYDVAKRKRAKRVVNPVFTFQLKKSKGRLVSDNKSSWTMKDASGKALYSYVMDTDRKTNAIKRENFECRGKSSTPAWNHGSQTDSLNFKDPLTDTHYRWLSNRPISTLNHERFDFQRNALFQRQGNHEVLVADWAWWDGHEDPEDCLAIRDPNIDHAMVIASLCIVHDHQWQIMAEERDRDRHDLGETESQARLTMLGCASHWCSSDFATQSSGSGGTGKVSKWHTANQLLASFNQGMETANNIASIQSNC